MKIFKPYTSELLLGCVNNHSWKTFLDLGCAKGPILKELKKRGHFRDKKIYAIDIRHSFKDYIEEIDKDIIFFNDSACNLKNIENNSIDLLVSSQVMEHAESDEKMIEEVKRVLSKNGLAYITTVFKKKWAWYFYRCGGKWRLDPTHVREYTKDDQLLPLFTKHGFKILKTKKNMFWFHLPFYRKIKIPIFGYYNWEIILRNK
ncbi:hypothetical protein CL621_02115 [archaeon]|nr:hypothetical protein [archaeon]|tara:strand:+ start:603 stop:1211 length:609 start_codon:yes stop_codon:yes gene_type:complete